MVTVLQFFAMGHQLTWDFEDPGQERHAMKFALLVTSPSFGETEFSYEAFATRELAEKHRERFSTFDSHRMTIHDVELELPIPAGLYRRIHVDQGRRATNKVHEADHDIIRVDNSRGDALAWGGTIVMSCPCGKQIARFVQPLPDRAFVVVAEKAILDAVPGERVEE